MRRRKIQTRLLRHASIPQKLQGSHTSARKATSRLGWRYWPSVKIFTPASRTSRIVARISSSVSPSPSIRLVFVTAPRFDACSSTERLCAYPARRSRTFGVRFSTVSILCANTERFESAQCRRAKGRRQSRGTAPLPASTASAERSGSQFLQYAMRHGRSHHRGPRKSARCIHGPTASRPAPRLTAPQDPEARAHEVFTWQNLQARVHSHIPSA